MAADDIAPEMLLVVERGGHRIGVWARAVVEVHAMVAVSPLPGGPEVVEGVVDAHGTLVPVLDLSVRFAASPRAAQADDRLVLVDTGARVVGLHVDHDVDLVAPAEGDIRAAVLEAAPFATGVAVLPDGLVLIHDVEAFLSSDEIIRLDLVMAGGLEGLG